MVKTPMVQNQHQHGATKNTRTIVCTKYSRTHLPHVTFKTFDHVRQMSKRESVNSLTTSHWEIPKQCHEAQNIVSKVSSTKGQMFTVQLLQYMSDALANASAEQTKTHKPIQKHNKTNKPIGNKYAFSHTRGKESPKEGPITRP